MWVVMFIAGTTIQEQPIIMINSVLVVDDSKMSRKLVIRSLPPEWDVPVYQAANGIEALDIFHEKNPT